MRYAVISTSDSGYVQCIGICDNINEAFGKAYLDLTDGYDDGALFSVTVPERSEGDCGYVINLVERQSGSTVWTALILEVKDEQINS